MGEKKRFYIPQQALLIDLSSWFRNWFHWQLPKWNFCEKKFHKHTAPTTIVYNFHSGPNFFFFMLFTVWWFFLYDHSLRFFSFPYRLWFGHFHRSIHLFSFHLCAQRQTQCPNDILVSKFGFKTPESPLNFDKITVDDSLTRQERRRKTLPRNYTHPKKNRWLTRRSAV